MKYGAKDNEIAVRFRSANAARALGRPLAGPVDPNSRHFLMSPEWRDIRELIVAWYGSNCMKCKRASDRPNVDHIKPRKTHPHLALVFSNLQVLCSRCNKFKGNKHATDYRGE